MKLIILDRDGVINQDSPDYIKSPDEWHPLPGSLEAIAKLNKAGYTIIVVTNQSGVGRGYYSRATLRNIHKKMKDELAKHGGEIERIYLCPHKPEDDCDCRKPNIGMFKEIEHDYKINLYNVINIGDSLRDLQAGKLVGCKNILVLTGNGKETLKNNPAFNNTEVYTDLAEAAKKIIKDQAK
jgi:D-glycero-D-manno-heptose 1,7-bisphosphate phosphatase